MDTVALRAAPTAIYGDMARSARAIPPKCPVNGNVSRSNAVRQYASSKQAHAACALAMCAWAQAWRSK